VIFESAAIALYLSDLFPEAKLGPRVGEPKRGALLSWLAYRPGVMEPAFIMRRLGVQHMQGAMGWAAAEEVEAFLERLLAENRYFLGDAFSVADIMVGGGIHYLMMFKVMNETPVFKEYAARITARPAFQRMMQKDAAAG
jgi:glutathione S-transferase